MLGRPEAVLGMARSSFILLLTAVLTWPLPAAVDREAGIWMEIPELEARIPANGAAVVATSDVSHFRVHIPLQPGQVNYGSIFAKINTEAANIVMTTSSEAEGILCKFDLNLRGGFRLRPGRNSVEISFKDRYQRLYYASFLVQAASEKDGLPLQPPARPEVLQGTMYAVVVGVSRYKYGGAGLKNLRFADRDAQAFRDFLLSPEGGSFPPENVRFLVNEEATAENLRSALFTFLTKPRAQDVVVLYFAGHGAPDPNDRRNLYLLTYDTRPDDMGGTGFPMWQLQDVFSRILKAKRVVTFTDSCHSFGISGERLTPLRQNNLVNQYLARYAGEGDRAVITASDISQLSYESEQWDGGHGVFTHFLLRGLRGGADQNKDGTVTAGELFPYVRQQVGTATQQEQTPVALPGLAQALPLSGLGVRKQAHSPDRGDPSTGGGKP
ncbi:MAG: caspase family protein [Terriglobales bacterium]